MASTDEQDREAPCDECRGVGYHHLWAHSRNQVLGQASKPAEQPQSELGPDSPPHCAYCFGFQGKHLSWCKYNPAAGEPSMDGCAEESVTAMQAAAILSGRHPLSVQFHELLKAAGEMHDAKQQDYGSATDPFANVRAASEWGMPGWVGAMVRVNDKVRRLQAFARKGVLKNESAEDSFMDIAVYALIALVLYREDSEQRSEGHEDSGHAES